VAVVVVVAQVILVVEAVSAVVVAHLAVDPAVHLPKDATPLTARTSTSYRKDDNRNRGFNSLSGQSNVYGNRDNTLDRRQVTVDKVHNDLRANRERGKVEVARDRAQNTESREFGSTTMLAPAPRKAGQQIFSNGRLGKSFAQRGIDNPIEAPQLCSRIVKILDQLYVHECASSEPGSGVALAIEDGDSVDVSKDFSTLPWTSSTILSQMIKSWRFSKSPVTSRVATCK